MAGTYAHFSSEMLIGSHNMRSPAPLFFSTGLLYLRMGTSLPLDLNDRVSGLWYDPLDTTVMQVIDDMCLAHSLDVHGHLMLSSPHLPTGLSRQRAWQIYCRYALAIVCFTPSFTALVVWDKEVRTAATSGTAPQV